MDDPTPGVLRGKGGRIAEHETFLSADVSAPFCAIAFAAEPK